MNKILKFPIQVLKKHFKRINLINKFKICKKISNGKGAFTINHISEGLKLVQRSSRTHYILKQIKPMPKKSIILMKYKNLML